MSGWPKSALYTAVGLVGLGFIFIFFAWNGAAGKDYVQGQVPYLISGGIIGLSLIISGLTVVVVQTIRREGVETRQKLDQLIDSVQEEEEPPAPATRTRRRAS